MKMFIGNRAPKEMALLKLEILLCIICYYSIYTYMYEI